MVEIDEAKSKLKAFRNADLNVLNPEMQKTITEFIDSTISDLDEIDKINHVKTEIQSQIIKPISEIIVQNKRLQIFSILLSISSVALACFTIWNTHYKQPEIIKEASNEAYEKIKALSIKPIKHELFKSNGKIGLKGTDNKIIIEAKYDDIEFIRVDQYQNHYKVRKDNLFGIINSNGKEILEPIYLNCSRFSNKQYKAKNKYGFVAIFDFEGQKVIPFKFKDIVGHHEKYVFCKVEDKWGVLDKSNLQMMVEPRFDEVLHNSSSWKVYFGVENELLKVYKFPNELVSKESYSKYIYSAMPLLTSKGERKYVFGVSKGKYQGLIDEDGNVLVDVKYDEVKYLEENKYLLNRGGVKTEFSIEF